MASFFSSAGEDIETRIARLSKELSSLRKAAAKRGAQSYEDGLELASDTYDDAANSFWDRFGRETVERLALERGASVLDACCGAGASALPAARAVGPEGRVLGVDLAEELLALARRKAAERGLVNVEFRSGDLLDLGFPEASFDAAVCVFGIFFLPDMDASADALIRLLRPGGRFVVTTWAENSLTELSHALREALARQGRTLERTPPSEAMDRINSPERLKNWLTERSLSRVTVDPLALELPLSAESAWNFVLGTGKRRVLDELSDQQRRRLRSDFVAELHDTNSMSATVLIGIGTRPESFWRR